MTLLGSGGAASSICVQAALDGAREIDVLSIKDNFWSKAEKLVSDINNNTDCKVNLIEMNDDSLENQFFQAIFLQMPHQSNGTKYRRMPSKGFFNLKT